MENITLTELTFDEQETLCGGTGNENTNTNTNNNQATGIDVLGDGVDLGLGDLLGGLLG